MLKKENIFSEPITDDRFLELSLSAFRFQYNNNGVYSAWTDGLGINPDSVTGLHQIPFLPVEFFKSKQVVSTPVHKGTVKFSSSGTTSAQRSVHYVNDMSYYDKSLLTGFRIFYGDPSDYCILALLPGYIERGDSSLVYMCDKLIRLSHHPAAGFYLNNFDDLKKQLDSLNKTGVKALLIGLSSALLRLGDDAIGLRDNITIVETGGMKGEGKELLKQELHEQLREKFLTHNIHSEYGMTELLSQAYSRGGGLYEAPPWMRFLIRETDDPLNYLQEGRTGGINVIDLANIHSCCFIATKDLGRLHSGSRLELMGRYDNSDIRGCNLMFAGNY